MAANLKFIYKFTLGTNVLYSTTTITKYIHFVQKNVIDLPDIDFGHCSAILLFAAKMKKLNQTSKTTAYLVIHTKLRVGMLKLNIDTLYVIQYGKQ